MKYIKLMIMAVLLTVVGRTQADNLKVANVEMKAGETKEIAIELNNPSKQYAAFQFDLVLPDGISIAKNDKGKLIANLDTDRKDDHTLTVSDVGSNTYRFLTFSMTNAEFYETSGALVKLTLQAADGIGSGAKTATIKSQVFTEVGGDQAKWSDLNFTITVPVEVNVNVPKAKSGLVYTGSAQELVSAGSTNVGVLQYSLDGSSYNTAIPKGTDAKTYTVYYKAANGNQDLTTAASLTVTISPKTVSNPAISLSATSFVYDGQEKKPTVTVKDGNTTIPASEYTVSYSNNINVGTATVTITDKNGGNYVVSGSKTFQITAPSATLTPPSAKTGLVYTGSAQELVNAGSSTTGEVQYSLDGSNYSKAISKGTDAKTYTVYYKVKGDANHGDTEPATLTVTISPKTVSSPTITLSATSFVYDGQEKKPTVTVKDGNTTIPASEYTFSYSNNVNVGTATVTITDKNGGNYVVSGSTTFQITAPSATLTPPSAKTGLVYTGSAQELVNAGSSTTGEVQYSLDGSDYNTAIPKGTDAKTYTVYYRVKGDANHNDTAPETLTVTISPKTVNDPTITLSETSFIYDGKEKKPTVTVEDGNTTIPASEYTVSYSNNINVGTATVTITDNEGGNYIVSGTVSFEIKEPAINVVAPTAISGLVYNGNTQGLITPGNTSVGKMLYSLDNYNYHTYLPAMKHAMTYTVYYKVVDDTETKNLTAPASLTVTISKAPLTISVGDYTMAEGDQVPEFKLQYDGFKGNDSEAVLTTKPTITCKATSESAPGRYEIIVSGAEAQDYDISYQSGWLTIEVAQGIVDIITNGQPFDVYNTQGHKVRSGVTSLKGLPKGVYIINGKKVIK